MKRAGHKGRKRTLKVSFRTPSKTHQPSSASAAPAKPEPIPPVVNFLKRFPQIVISKILDAMDPVTATCFGLICRDNHELYKKVHLIALRLCRLNCYGMCDDPEHRKYGCLPCLLNQWMGPDLLYSFYAAKFVSKVSFQSHMGFLPARRAPTNQAEMQREEEEAVDDVARKYVKGAEEEAIQYLA